MVSPPTFAAAIAALVIAISVRSTARDLRPTDHGLEYQPNAPPPGKKSPPEMRSFFGPSPPDGRNNAALPKAVNSSEPLWLNAGRRGGDRVRKLLVVTSVLSGVAGVALLLVSALIYLFTFRKQKSSPSSSSCTNDSDDHNNSK